ncbi:MAG: lytic murein transglycosylase B [Betaproteobacteria bacterium]|jgi:membrane-bound lytic murein transglycosylase B|nr:lytic murein transglycosylase B [Betaproteobacteria bacterium]
MRQSRRSILQAGGLIGLAGLLPGQAVLAQQPAAKSPREPYAEMLADRLRFGWLGRSDVQEFISMMSDRHGLPRPWLESQFRNLGAQPRALALIAPPPPSPGDPPPRKRSWARYLSQHADASRTKEGKEFLARHREVFQSVANDSGVPAHIIAAIIGVETKYGSFTGRFPAVETLATLGFDSPRRSEFFLRELETLLVLGRQGIVNLKEVRGSFAGALGLPQFMPSSWQKFAVSYKNRGRPDLINSPADAIASVGNFLKMHGWKSGEASHSVAQVTEGADAKRFVAPQLEPVHTVAEIESAGIRQSNARLSAELKASLIDLPEEDDSVGYWFAAHNFFVITQYNRSFMYAAAVLTLSESLAAPT